MKKNNKYDCKTPACSASSEPKLHTLCLRNDPLGGFGGQLWRTFVIRKKKKRDNGGEEITQGCVMLWAAFHRKSFRKEKKKKSHERCVFVG